MRVFLNELALADAWTTPSSIQQPLKDILQARRQQSVLRNKLYCAGGIGGVPTSSGVPLSRAAQKLPRDIRVQFLDWVAKHGPFIEEDRQDIDEDLFYFGDHDVTYLGLGEAARRLLVKSLAATLSPVRDEHSRFAPRRLDVTHGLREEPIEHVCVPNYTELETLAKRLGAVEPDPKNWQDLLEICRKRFSLLLIGHHCEEVLATYPFSPAAGRRIIFLLRILHEIKAEMNSSGRLSTAGLELRSKFFSGERASFSDESESRKQKRRKFTFPDPDGGNDIVCFWHGKISTPAFRMYFDWPVKRPAGPLRVVYIGPHI